MKISRRALVGTALGVAAAATVGAVAIAGPTASPTRPFKGRGKYHPGPNGVRRRGPGDMIMEEQGRWHSHLLPFAAPMPSRAAVLAELKRVRSQRLIG